MKRTLTNTKELVGTSPRKNKLGKTAKKQALANLPLEDLSSGPLEKYANPCFILDTFSYLNVEPDKLNFPALVKKFPTLKEYDSYESVENLIRNICYTDESLYAKFDNQKGSYVGVCFSGGYDSTLCVARAIEQGKTVVPIILGVNHCFAGMWVLIEYSLLQLRRRYPRKITRAHVSISNIEFSDLSEFSGYRMQPSIAFSLGFINDALQKCLEEIQVGFICKDECISFLDEFENLYRAAFKFREPFHGEPVPLAYPLKKYVKSRVIEGLLSRSLLDSVAMLTCENPISKIFSNKNGTIVCVMPCEYCMSCKYMDATNSKIKSQSLLVVFGNEKMPSLSEVEAILKEEFNYTELVVD